MTKDKRAISEPTKDDERELNAIRKDEATEVGIPGTRKKYRIRWMKHETLWKITDIVLEDKEDRKTGCKIGAAVVLNDYWKLKFWWWALWRWFYYVRQYSDEQMLPIVMEGKKKVPQAAFYEITMYSIGMRDTIMTMKKEEVERFLQEHRGVQPSASEKKPGG